jgi:hypothetical protein
MRILVLAMSSHHYLDWIACFLLVSKAAYAHSATVVVTECSWNPAAQLILLGDDEYATCPRDIGGSVSKSSKWDPWTHEPYCVHPKGKKEPRYCAFTNANFQKGAGFSILTTPEVGQGLANTFEAIDQTWEEREMTMDPIVPPYIITDVPGKGKGVIAIRDIPRDEVIMVDLPLLLEMTEPPEFVKPRHTHRLMQKGFDQLSMKDQATVLALARSSGGEMNVFDDIMKTNVYSIMLQGKDHSGLFPEISVCFLTSSEGKIVDMMFRGSIMPANQSKTVISARGQRSELTINAVRALSSRKRPWLWKL